MKTNPGKILLTVACFLLFATAASAQTIFVNDKKKLKEKEDSLREWAQYMITDSLPEDRMYSDSIFTKVLVRALQIRNSFYYPFDSVFGISKLYAPDTSFRIFTWNVQYDDYWSQQRGAIQMRTKDGSLKLIGLHDVSTFTDKPDDSIRTRKNWIGAVYYNIYKTQHKGKNYYTLFGLDHHGVQSDKKWIEVMHFDEKNEPIFGGPFFTYQNDSIPKPPKYRLSMEFKQGARVLANYIPDLEMVLVDHLISEGDQPDLPWTFVPDGDNEGYQWENGKWVHIDKVFTFKLKDGEAPVDNPLMDNKGKKDEKKLLEQLEKNKPKTNQKIPINYDN